MSQVKWLPEALADIERLYSFLHEKNPAAAMRAARVILEGARILESSVHVGRPMEDDTKRRELFLPFNAGAYVLRYRVEHPDTAVVLRVWHSREHRQQ